MKKFMTVILALALVMCMVPCFGEVATSSENEADEVMEVVVTLPEDNGMAGVYKWIEMQDYGLDTYLILWDDGIGSTDIIGTGTVRGVFYDDKTMQVADEGTFPQEYTYEDGKLIWTYTDEQGEHVSTFVKLTAEERAAYEALGVGSIVEKETAEAEEANDALPEDDGMMGVYKWIEMQNYGLDIYLILYDGGIGATDIIGTGAVRAVFYDDKTMQVADEGTVPQEYTYEDGKLIWTYTDEQAEHVSTFVKLTAEERTAYEALGVGSTK